MQVYEGLNCIADITELTMVEVAKAQINLKILALQKRSRAAGFIEEYANHIVECIQMEAETIDNNGLEVVVAFPMIGGGALKVVFTGVNMSKEKYEQLNRALVLKIAGVAGRYYRWLGREGQSVESIVFRGVAKACDELYDIVKKEYIKHSYQNWKTDIGIKMKSYERDSELRLFCWAVDYQLVDDLNLEDRAVKKYAITSLSFKKDKDIVDSLTSSLIKLISEYSVGDPVIWLEAEELGIVWIIKPESTKFDGSIHISDACRCQIRYYVAEAISSLGEVWESLSNYAMCEAMNAMSTVNCLSKYTSRG